MNEMIKNTLNEACGEDFDLFEKAFNENTAHHKFSSRHKRKMEAVFKNCDNPVLARKKYEAKPFWSEFGVKQGVAAAASFVVASCLIFGGVKAVDLFSDLAEANEDQNKRYDELLKDGNYYLTTDDSIYFKVENGTLKLCGDKEKIIELFMNDEKLVKAHKEDPEFVKKYATDRANAFMSEMNYALVDSGEGGTLGEDGNVIPDDRLKYGFVNLDSLPDIPWVSLVFTGPWEATFDGENTIRISRIGNFVLAE